MAAFGPALFHNSVLEILQCVANLADTLYSILCIASFPTPDAVSPSARFGFNTVGDDGVVALADGLKVNTKLTTLRCGELRPFPIL